MQTYIELSSALLFAGFFFTGVLAIDGLPHDNLAGSRYLEDAVDVFRCIDAKDSSYFKCLSQLGNTYFDIYIQTNNLSYKRNAQLISTELNANRGRMIIPLR